MNFFKILIKSLGLAFSFLSRIPTGNKILTSDDPTWKYYTIFYPLCGAVIGYICLFITNFISGFFIDFNNLETLKIVLTLC